ncbi:hypothetical protein FOMG_18010 [Fusarium oxysporum f. sp. melonis 26406]|uniref:Uncharacterized protein n=1 Tax=Fusarium oxysporum f. sp. melonis 26406 TaxID=1089452 RepID=W9ZAM3_FUSOX|nr:hypothetical protein FOMG_18010 [Fusarium oxysporum f. sp. melonis 26406]
MPMKVIQKLLHHLIMRRITKISPATTVPFAQCNVRHCCKTKEKKKLHQSERRLSRRVPKFTKRAEQSMSEGSWVACLLTRPRPRRRWSMRSKKSSNICDSGDIEA